MKTPEARKHHRIADSARWLLTSAVFLFGGLCTTQAQLNRAALSSAEKGIFAAFEEVALLGANASGKSQALAYRYNDLLHAWSYQGDIPGKLLEANQKNFSRLNEFFLNKVAKENGMVTNFQKNTRGITPHTDTDVIVAPQGNRKMTASELQKARDDFYKAQQKYLTTNGVSGAPKDLKISLLPDASSMTRSEFENYTKMCAKAGEDVYTDPLAAMAEKKIRSGEPISIEEAAARNREANRLYKEKMAKAKEIDDWLNKNPNSPERHSKAFQAAENRQFAAKYANRMVETTNHLKGVTSDADELMEKATKHLSNRTAHQKGVMTAAGQNMGKSIQFKQLGDQIVERANQNFIDVLLDKATDANPANASAAKNSLARHLNSLPAKDRWKLLDHINKSKGAETLNAVRKNMAVVPKSAPPVQPIGVGKIALKSVGAGFLIYDLNQRISTVGQSDNMKAEAAAQTLDFGMNAAGSATAAGIGMAFAGLVGFTAAAPITGTVVAAGVIWSYAAGPTVSKIADEYGDSYRTEEQMNTKAIHQSGAAPETVKAILQNAGLDPQRIIALTGLYENGSLAEFNTMLKKTREHKEKMEALAQAKWERDKDNAERQVQYEKDRQYFDRMWEEEDKKQEAFNQKWNNAVAAWTTHLLDVPAKDHAKVLADAGVTDGQLIAEISDLLTKLSQQIAESEKNWKQLEEELKELEESEPDEPVENPTEFDPSESDGDEDGQKSNDDETKKEPNWENILKVVHGVADGVHQAAPAINDAIESIRTVTPFHIELDGDIEIEAHGSEPISPGSSVTVEARLSSDAQFKLDKGEPKNPSDAAPQKVDSSATTIIGSATDEEEPSKPPPSIVIQFHTNPQTGITTEYPQSGVKSGSPSHQQLKSHETARVMVDFQAVASYEIWAEAKNENGESIATSQKIMLNVVERFQSQDEKQVEGTTQKDPKTDPKANPNEEPKSAKNHQEPLKLAIEASANPAVAGNSVDIHASVSGADAMDCRIIYRSEPSYPWQRAEVRADESGVIMIPSEASGSFRVVASCRAKDGHQTEADLLIEVLPSELAQKEAEREKHMAQGKSLEETGDDQNAMASFIQAQQIRMDPVLNEHIEHLRQKIEEADQNQKSEQIRADLIAKGMSLESQEDFDEAMKSYLAARDIRQSTDLQERIRLLGEKIEEKNRGEDLEARRHDLIMEGQALEQAGDDAAAIQKYSMALQIRHDPQVAKKIVFLREKIERQKIDQEQEEVIKDLIAKAVELEKAGDLINSIQHYQQAQAMRNDPEVSKKISLLQQRMGEESDWDDLIAMGAERERADDLQGAIDHYQKALHIRHDSKVNERILDLKKRIADQEIQQAEDESKRHDLLVQGLDWENKNDFERALEAYKQAQQIQFDPSVETRIGGIQTRVRDPEISNGQGPEASGGGFLPEGHSEGVTPSDQDNDLGSGTVSDDVLEKAKTLEQEANTGAVKNKPTAPALYVVTEPMLISYISTYHWNFGRGAVPGTLALQHSDGTLYGPWPATGADGMGGVKNATWETLPKVIVKEGTYTLVDSDPDTWAQNAGTGGRGMFEIRGAPAREIPQITQAGTSSNSAKPIGNAVENEKHHLKFVVGAWKIIGNGHLGKIEFAQSGAELTGRVWYDHHGRWEILKDVSFDGRTLSFLRPIPQLDQRYNGQVNNQEIAGTFDQAGSGAYEWKIWRDKSEVEAQRETHDIMAKVKPEKLTAKGQFKHLVDVHEVFPGKEYIQEYEFEFWNVGDKSSAPEHGKVIFIARVTGMEDETCVGNFSGGPDGIMTFHEEGEEFHYRLEGGTHVLVTTMRVNGENVEDFTLRVPISNPNAFANWPKTSRE